MRPCPSCHMAVQVAEDGRCARCGGRWLRAAEVAAALGPDQAAVARRLAARGPLTSLNCADCRAALKSFDVPGHMHEGDLFWGHESPRPAGTAVVDGCPRCGGLWLPSGEMERAGGEASLLRNLRDARP